MKPGPFCSFRVQVTVQSLFFQSWLHITRTDSKYTVNYQGLQFIISLPQPKASQWKNEGRLRFLSSFSDGVPHEHHTLCLEVFLGVRSFPGSRLSAGRRGRGKKGGPLRYNHQPPSRLSGWIVSRLAWASPGEGGRSPRSLLSRHPPSTP